MWAGYGDRRRTAKAGKSSHFPIKQIPAARLEPQSFALLLKQSTHLHEITPTRQAGHDSTWLEAAQVSPSTPSLVIHIDRRPGPQAEPCATRRQTAIKHPQPERRGRRRRDALGADRGGASDECAF